MADQVDWDRLLHDFAGAELRAALLPTEPAANSVTFTLPDQRIAETLTGKTVVTEMFAAMMRKAGPEVVKQIMLYNAPVVVDLHLETWHDDNTMRRRMTLHWNMQPVPRRTLPVFTFVNHEGVREWKCPACGTINKMDATYCGELHKRAVGCSRPRDKERTV